MLDGQIEERAVGADAGVRDDDVDPAELRRGRVADGDDLVEVAHVALLRDDAVEAEVVAAARCEPEVHPALVQHARERGADAAARTGDDRGLAFEAHEHSSSGRRVG